MTAPSATRSRSAFSKAPRAYGQDVAGWYEEYLFRMPTSAEQGELVAQMVAGATDRGIEQQIADLPEFANNPPTPPAGTAAPLPDYLHAPAASVSSPAVAAKDAFFSGF